jgi:flagellar basal body P-ring formation protein FlgA
MKAHLMAIVAAGLSGLASTAALALPVLETQVDTADAVVTVGDMFKDAGRLASQPLFLAPAPGTTGTVPIEEVRDAAARAGLNDFDDGGVQSVEVSRRATPVTATILSGLVGNELKARGVLTPGITAQTSFDTPLDGLDAAAVHDPVQLVDLRYTDDGAFAARFTLAGIAMPVDVSGHFVLMTEAPELASTLAGGTILSASDIVERPVPLSQVQNTNVAALDQLVGKALQRQSHAGMVLKISDVADPIVIARNDMVTVYLHAGPMTLSVRGTALNSASAGDPVSVLNTLSKRIVRGIARPDGAVEMSAVPVSVAGL